MNWADYMGTVYFRIYVRLTAYEKVMTAIDGHLEKYGPPPSDSVRLEALRTLDQLRTMRAVVAAAYEGLPHPYRPGVDPWRTSGLSARLKADFEGKGVTEPTSPRPPLPEP